MPMKNKGKIFKEVEGQVFHIVALPLQAISSKVEFPVSQLNTGQISKQAPSPAGSTVTLQPM